MQTLSLRTRTVEVGVVRLRCSIPLTWQSSGVPRVAFDTLENSSGGEALANPTRTFPSSAAVEQAQLAPYRLRAQAFALDVSLLVPISVVGGLIAVIVSFVADFGWSTRTALILLIAVMFSLGAMNAVLAWLTQGQTVGKAHYGLVERRRAQAADFGEAAGLGRLLGRHTVGYLVIDVFGLGTLAMFRLARRRCLHDVAFDTEVSYIGGHESPSERRKAMDERRLEALEEIRESGGWQYNLVKWASRIVIRILEVTVVVLTLLGVLAKKADAASTPHLSGVSAPSGPSTLGLTGLAVTTTSMTFAVVATLGDTDPRLVIDGPSVFATEVLDHSVGIDVGAPHDLPNEALGIPDGEEYSGFFALGNGDFCTGRVDLAFDDAQLADAPGPDLIVHETEGIDEQAYLFLGDGDDWIDAGEFFGTAEIDIAGLSARGRFTAVRICSATDRPITFAPWGGYDLDAVELLHYRG